MTNRGNVREQTVRRIIDSYIANRGRDPIVYPEGGYFVAYDEGESYLFLLLKVNQDKRYFIENFKRSPAVQTVNNLARLVRRDGHISNGEFSFRTTFDHVPFDITDEELRDVAKYEQEIFGSVGTVRFSKFKIINQPSQSSSQPSQEFSV